MTELTEDKRAEINELSFGFEEVEHGSPSGIDNFVSVYGGVIVYNRLKQPRFRRISAIHKLRGELEVAIADSKIEKNTKTAVQMVKDRCSNNEEGEFVLTQIEKGSDSWEK